jgi:hypothetical protein
MRRSPALLVVILAAGCGGSSAPTTPPVTPPTNPYTFTITTGGVNPKELTVPPGTRVLILNNDARRRNMTSDPHPEHNDCPEINDVGLLNTGQGRETGNLVVVRTCGFHDHDDPDNASVKGRIVIRP